MWCYATGVFREDYLQLKKQPILKKHMPCVDRDLLQQQNSANNTVCVYKNSVDGNNSAYSQ